MSDFRYALRQLLRSPGFTAVTLLMLALGIGATTTIFSLVNTTFLRPLPYPAPEQLVFLQEGNARGDHISTSYPNFLDWQAQQDTFSGLALFRIDRRTFKSAETVEQVALAYVSADFFSVLGARVALGRTLSADDDRPGAGRVIWLTHDTWQQRFGSAPDAVGRTVSIADQAFTIAGILSPEFRFQRRIEFVAAIAPEAGNLFMLQRQNRNDAYVLGRLKPGMSLEQAQAQFSTIGERIAQTFPEGNDGVRPVLLPLRDHLARGARSQQLMLLGAVGMLLLITCVNVANLLLARASSRDREMAVRAAIGASRWQITRQLLTESLLLALGGGALGALLGAWGYDFAQRLIPWELQPLAGDAGFDARVLLFVLGVAVLTGVGFGLAPAWRLSHADPNDALKNTPRLVNTFLGRFRLANVLVIAQVALALMLLVGAGLMIRSLQRLTAINPGFQPAQLLTVQPAPPSMQEYSRDPLSTTRYYEAMLENVLRLPAVQSAGFIAGLPFTSSQSGANFFRTDRPLPSGSSYPFTHTHTVTPDYFRTMGIPLQRGRLLSGREPIPALEAGVPMTPENISKAFRSIILEVVISQRMAELYWPDEDPVGKRFQLGFPEMNLPVAEIVGVVGNTTQNGLDQAPPPEAYLSIRQFPTPMPMHLVVRSPLDAAALAPLVRTAIAEIAKDKPILDLKPMTARIDESVDRRRFNLTLFTFFAGSALLLAALGLYGVLGFVVSRRTRELGLRMALGAQRHQVLANVLWRGFGLVLLGTALGLGGAWALSRLIESQLFGTARTDPFTYAAAAALLLLVALIACVIPARRATRINPTEALRAD